MSKKFRKVAGANLLVLVLLLSGLLVACGDATSNVSAPNAGAATTLAATTAAVTTQASVTTTRAATTSAATLAALATTATAPATTAPAQTSQPGVAAAGQTTLATSPATITKANGQTVSMTIELARTSQEQSTGLMGRTSVPDGQGMLFVFRESGIVGFWMKNTPLALSIAFIDENGLIIDIKDMQPFSEKTVAPDSPYLLALEVSQGYFARQGIKPGDTFKLAVR